MEILSGSALVKLKSLQGYLNNLWRYTFDSNYRHFWDDYEYLEKILSEPMQIAEDIQPEKLKGWTPVELHLNKKYQVVAWINLGNTSFTDKCSTDTVCRAWRNQNKCQPIWTKLDILTDLQNISPGLKPKGFIFNVSKCGSTLLAKMLSSLPHNLVISEDRVISNCLMPNELMAEAGGFSESFRSGLLTSAISALGQPRLGVEENYIIRFTPKDVLELPLLRKIFPDVPWVFLYRDPLEVVVSDLVDMVGSYRNMSEIVRQVLNLSATDITRISPEHTYLVKQILDFSASEIERMSNEEFLARRNGIYLQMALNFLDKNSLLINYQELLSESGLTKIINFFKIQVSEAKIATMLGNLQNYSKDNLRKQAYKDDRETKQKMASQKVRNLIDQWATKSYLQLEEIRQSTML